MALNGNQRIAVYQIRYAIYDIAGGYENSVTDGQIKETELPSFTELRDEVYDGIMNNTYDEGSLTTYPQKEIKFCGRDWLMKRVEKRLTKYMDEEAEYSYQR